MKKVAVIILNWEGEKLLREYLPKVIATTDPELADVIVADNGSNDGSVRLVSEEFPTVKLHRFLRNHGYADGYNRAIAEYRDYPITVLLNSDVAPGEGWLQPLVDFLEANPQAGACQPKVLSYREPERFEYAGACGGYIDRNGYPYCRGRLFADCEIDHGQYDSIAEVFWATGAALAIRTDLYLEAGGLDPEFFAHMEEIDLCWRIKLMGYKIYAVPQSVIYHLGGGSLPANSPRKTFLNFRNNLVMMHKNLPDNVRWRRLFVRRLLDMLAWARFVFARDWDNAFAVWRAHRDYVRMKREYKSTHPKEDLLVGRPNIVVQYFIKGRKKFSDLVMPGKSAR